MKKKNEKKGSVFLDITELTFLYRHLEQTLLAKEKELGGSQKKLKAHAGYQIGSGLLKRLAPLKVDSVLHIRGRECRLLANLIPPVIDVLETSTIPTYERKMLKHPEHAAHFGPYVEKSKSLVLKLTKLKERLHDAS